MKYKKILLPVVIFFALALYLKPLRSAETQKLTLNHDALTHVINEIWENLKAKIAKEYHHKYFFWITTSPENLSEKLKENNAIYKPFSEEQSLEFKDLTNQVEASLKNIIKNTNLESILPPLVIPKLSSGLIPSTAIMPQYLQYLSSLSNEELQTKGIFKLKNPELERLSKLIFTAVSTAFLGEYATPSLFWCDCMPAPGRIAYSLQVIYDTQEQFPDKSHPLVYTALAAGKLFQDLVILKTLVADGYKNIIANFIDIGYPDPILTARIANALGEDNMAKAIVEYEYKLINIHIPSGESFEEKNKKWQEEYEKEYPTLAKVKEKEAEKYATILNIFNKELPGTTINLYHNMTDYLYRAQQKPELYASDIITLVDPDVALFQISPYPTESNLMGISINELGDEHYHRPHIFISMLENKPIEIRAEEKIINLPEAQSLLNEAIIRAIEETNSLNQYTPKFRTRLLELISTYDPMALKQQLPAYIELLDNAHQDESTDVETINNILEETIGIIEEYKTNIETLANQGNESAQTLHRNKYKLQQILESDSPKEEKCKEGANLLRLIVEIADKLKQKYTISWYSDSHLAFQKLVAGAATNKTLIYIYAKKDKKPLLEKFTKKEFLEQDILGRPGEAIHGSISEFYNYKGSVESAIFRIEQPK